MAPLRVETKARSFKLPLERPQRVIQTHLAAQSGHMGPTTDYFARILVLFFRRSLGTVILTISLVRYSHFRVAGYPRIMPFCIFPYTVPRTIPEGTLIGTFDEFYRFYFSGGTRLPFGANFICSFRVLFEVNNLIDFGTLLGGAGGRGGACLNFQML